MMKLKFSVEDILRDDTKLKTVVSASSHQGALIDAKRLVTSSDGESVRSESPDSTTSMTSDDVDKKGARRIRTMIQHWQKELLETSFANHQYPTVHQYESLSKQLGLPHYVTKVWFQNRRSKSRKEGTREQHRRNFDPYPIKDQSPVESGTDERKSLRGEAGEQRLMESMHDLPLLQYQGKHCNCDECVAASINMAKRSNLAQLVAMKEVCNCRECIDKRSANGLIETRLTGHGSIDSHRFQMQYDSRRADRFCDCHECIAELQKIDVAMKRSGGAPFAFQNSGMADFGVPMQFMQPQAGPGAMRRRGTLHYLALPHKGNYSKHVDGELTQNCDCNNCRANIRGVQY